MGTTPRWSKIWEHPIHDKSVYFGQLGYSMPHAFLASTKGLFAFYAWDMKMDVTNVKDLYENVTYVKHITTFFKITFHE